MSNILQFGQRAAKQVPQTCRHEELAAGWEIKLQGCQNSPLPGKLFCETHDACNDFLEAGKALGYPELEITESLTVGRDYNGYLAYAERMPQRHALLVRQALKKAANRHSARITTMSEVKLQSIINRLVREDQQ